MDWDKVKAELDGLSEAQLRMLVELAFGWLLQIGERYWYAKERQ